MAMTPQTSAREALGQIGVSRAVGWIGLDAPLELIDAAGLTPLRVTADPAAPSPAAELYAEGVGHPMLRALAGAVIELAEAGLQRLLVSTTPVRDFSLYAFLASLQRAGAALQGLKLTAVDVLHGDSPADHAHNLDLFARLGGELAGGAPMEAPALQAAIEGRNRIRERLGALEVHRRTGALGGVEALAIHAQGDVLPADLYLQRLDTRLAEVASRPGRAARPILVSGSAETAARTYPVYEALGLNVVGDDHDAGSRAIGPLVALAGDPLEALAERYRARTPAPSGWSTAAATEALVSLATRQGAEAVVFDIPLYDHSAAWDFPAKRAALEAAGIACTVLPPNAFRDPETAARAAAQALIAETA